MAFEAFTLSMIGKRAMALDQIAVMRSLGFARFAVAGHDRGGRCACLRGRRHLFDAAALADYLRCYRDPRTVHAICEDYRAAASSDRALDEADPANGRRVVCPLLALWGGRGNLQQWYDVLAVWRDWCEGDVRGRALDCGHYLADEVPDDTFTELHAWFSSAAAA